MSEKDVLELHAHEGPSEQGKQVLRRFKIIYVSFRALVYALVWGSLVGGAAVFQERSQLLAVLILVLLGFMVMRLKSAALFVRPDEKISFFVLRVTYFLSFCFGFYQVGLPELQVPALGSWSFVCGLCFYLVGLLLWWQARMCLSPHYYDVVYVHQEQTVCTHGPYAYLRHPGYCAEWLSWVGGLLLLNRFWPVFTGSILLLVALVYRIWVEEKVLLEQLDGYANYCQQVKRFKYF